MAQRDYDFLFKMVLVGDTGIGKSSLLLRFAENKFVGKALNSLSVDFKFQSIKVDKKTVKLQIWDTAGQERFQTLTSAYFRRADGIMLVYDVTCQESFDHVSRWLEEVSRYAPEGTLKILVGNKKDLVDERVVSSDTAQEYANTLGIPFIETSAKNDDKCSSESNVDEAFRVIATNLKNKGSPSSNGASDGTKLSNDQKKNKGGCC